MTLFEHGERPETEYRAEWFRVSIFGLSLWIGELDERPRLAMRQVFVRRSEEAVQDAIARALARRMRARRRR